MLLPLRSRFLLFCLLLPLASCANSSLGEGVQRSLQADPRLTGASPSPVVQSPTPSPEPSVEPSAEPSVEPTESPSPSPSATQSPNSFTQISPFTDQFAAGASGTSDGAATNQPNSSPSPASDATAFSDIEKAPKELRRYVEDLAKLGVLSIASSNAKSASDSTRFEPNKVITRREYARWLVSVNNRLVSSRPAQQIRLGSDSSQPAFQDVPRSDRDFAAIQGLAEAGLIPSPLSGDSTTVTFRPNDPLTRENLVLWKVPIDSRQPLPTANIDAVKQTWGFQDAARIDARALRAVLADFQNGDLANIRRAFGYTTLFQPKKAVTRAEAAAALWYIGYQGEGQSAQDALKPAGG